MLSAFVVALLVSSVVALLVVYGAPRFGLVASPADPRHIHTRPVPRLGGIAVYVGTMAGVVATLLMRGGSLAGSRHGFFLAILLGGTVLFLTGLVDDVVGMRPVVKLGLQSAAASLAYLVGQRIQVLSFGAHTQISVALISFPLTVLWIVGVTNAFNLIDGLDGLAAGIAMVVLVAVGAAATLLGNGDVVLVCMALVGALLGFLRLNAPPAKLFLGDSGSLFVGFMLAMLSVHGSLKSATTVLIAIPIGALALPMLDVALAIVRRWLRGSPIFGADARHLHHRLLSIGLNARTAATLLCTVAAAFAGVGLMLAFAPPPAILAISLAGGIGALVLILVSVRRLKYHEITEAGSVLASGIARLRRVMHDQIHARETAQLVSKVRSIAALNGMLASRAAEFGFLAIEVGRESEIDRGTRALREARRRERPWKLDFPVTPLDDEMDDPFVLRIWCDLRRGYRPFAAERVARIVAPAIEEWLARVEIRATAPIEVNSPTAVARLLHPGAHHGEAVDGGSPHDAHRPTAVALAS